MKRLFVCLSLLFLLSFSFNTASADSVILYADTEPKKGFAGTTVFNNCSLSEYSDTVYGFLLSNKAYAGSISFSYNGRLKKIDTVTEDLWVDSYGVFTYSFVLDNLESSAGTVIGVDYVFNTDSNILLILSKNENFNVSNILPTSTSFINTPTVEPQVVTAPDCKITEFKVDANNRIKLTIENYDLSSLLCEFQIKNLSDKSEYTGKIQNSVTITGDRGIYSVRVRFLRKTNTGAYVAGSWSDEEYLVTDTVTSINKAGVVKWKKLKKANRYEVYISKNNKKYKLIKTLKTNKYKLPKKYRKYKQKYIKVIPIYKSIKADIKLCPYYFIK